MFLYFPESGKGLQLTSFESETDPSPIGSNLSLGNSLGLNLCFNGNWRVKSLNLSSGNLDSHSQCTFTVSGETPATDDGDLQWSPLVLTAKVEIPLTLTEFGNRKGIFRYPYLNHHHTGGWHRQWQVRCLLVEPQRRVCPRQRPTAAHVSQRVIVSDTIAVARGRNTAVRN